MTDKKRSERFRDGRAILVGAEDPLPPGHFWFEGKGYSIYAADQPRSAWREHSHDCAQITIGLEPARVHAEWRTGSSPVARRELSGNAVSMIPPGVPHRTLWQRRAGLVHIYLDNDLLAATAKKVLRRKGFKLRLAYLVRDPLIEELGRALYRECETGELCADFADSVLSVLTTHLVRSYDGSAGAMEARGGLGPSRERAVCEYIEASLDGDLSIAALAKVAGLSESHFATLFRQATGFSPHQYVTRRRVERAQQLLENADVPLVEVAHRCGFVSQSQFTTLFRRFAGLTPGRFRERVSR